MRKVVQAIFLLVLLCQTTLAATYYVASNGNDANVGTQTLPWKTIGKVNNVQLLAGDQVLFRRGDIFSDNKLMITKSGSATKQIIYGAYGTGTKPIISGSNMAANRGPGLIEVSNADYITIDGLSVQNSKGYGIKTLGGSSFITIKNCEVAHAVDGGIVFEYANGDRRPTNETVDNCEVHHNFESLGMSGWHESITFENVNGFVARNNYVHNNGKEGIDAKYGATKGKIYNNTIHNNKLQIYIDGADNIEIYNNTLASNEAGKSGIGIGVESTYNDRHTTLHDVFVHNNIITNSASGIWMWIESGAETYGSVYNVRIVNNVITGNNLNNWGGFFFSAGAPSIFTTGNIIENNIVYDNTRLGGSGVFRDSVGITNKFTINHNLIKTGEPLGSSYVKSSDQIYTSDPKFISSSSGNFHLQANSSAIDAGVDVGLPYVGSAPDIGAFEYTTFSPPPINISLNSIMIVNANTNQVIEELQDASTINLATMPTRNLNLMVQSSATTRSVQFTLNGRTYTKNAAPYTITNSSSGIAWTLQPGTYDLRAVAFSGLDGTGQTGNTLQFTFTVTDEQPTIVSTIAAVNAGGNTYTSQEGINYVGDDSSHGNAYSTTAAISNTQDDVLYQSERWKNGTITYEFTVQNGVYDVTLKFAEVFFSGVGQRVFDVWIEGNNIRDDFDIFENAGSQNTAYDISHTTSVNDGSLSIALTSVFREPKINAIVITKSSSLRGDVNADGTVNVIDLVATVNQLSSLTYDSNYDFNSDGIIDVRDLLILVGLFS